MMTSPGGQIDEETWDAEIEEKLINSIKKLENKLKEFKEIKINLDIQKVKPLNKNDYKISAIDSSYSTPPIETIAGNFYLLRYGYISNCGKKKLFEEVKILNSDKEIRIYSSLKERKLIKSLLNDDFDIIILDGPINNFIASPFRFYPEKTKELIENLLYEIKSNDKTLITITKRIKSRILASYSNVNINDRILTNEVLKNGEYIYVGKYKDVIPNYEKFLRKELGKNIEYGETLSTKYYKEIELVYLKTTIPIKIEVFNAKDIEEVLGIIYRLTSYGKIAYPYLLDLADYMVRVKTFETVKYYNLVRKYLKNKNLIEKINPQKDYLFFKKII